jgi:hypothetical protein
VAKVTTRYQPSGIGQPRSIISTRKLPPQVSAWSPKHFVVHWSLLPGSTFLVCSEQGVKLAQKMPVGP